MKAVAVAALLLGVMLAGSLPARAEYRAYELEITDILDCVINQREKCKQLRVRTAMSPDLYVRMNGGEQRLGVVLLATWVCWGDTSGFAQVCPRPAARKPKFAVGDEVQVRLKKHVTEGWKGKIEVAYFQRAINANVYGVRFAERQQVFARYFEKDLAKAANSPQSEPPQ